MYRDRPFSIPARVHFAGWESDTYRLQQAGWQLSAQEDIAYGSFQIAMKHEQFGIRGLSQRVPYEYMNQRHSPGYDFGLPDIPVALASSFHSQVIGTDFSKFSPIDAVPQFEERKIQSMDDLRIFAPNLVRTQEIIVPDYDVDQLLNMILEKQQPAREAHFKREIQGMRYDEIMKPRQKFHAQIISLVA
jgi:hypothetical protein